jgi:hypothetical protein
MELRTRRSRARILAFAFLIPAGPIAAQDAPAPPIQDNSFLVEEAYNQESGVVQHISSFARFREERDWVYTFTQEWPLGGQKHQGSFTFPVQDPGRSAGESGPGDVAVNYRYQALGGGGSRVAFSPRISLLLPTGEEREGRGSGSTGVQINLPLSIELSRSFVTHSNLGATRVPNARNETGDEADTTGVHVGQSLIWLVRREFNLMLEAVLNSDEEVTAPGRAERGSSFFLSPGARWAIDFDSGLQIVPGVAVPVGLGASRGDTAVLLYLSFEHPFLGSPSPLRE